MTNVTENNHGYRELLNKRTLDFSATLYYFKIVKVAVPTKSPI